MVAAVGFSRHPVTATAAGEVVGQLLESLGATPDLAVLAVTPGHAGALEDVAGVVMALLGAPLLVGVVSRGPATATDPAPTRRAPALACLAATVGGPLAVVADGEGPPPWRAGGALRFDDGAARLPAWLTCPVAGGAVDGAGTLVGTREVRGGVTVVARDGIEVVGAAGERPFGPLLEVTRASGPMVVELDDRPAHEALTAVVADHLPAADLHLVGRGLAVHVDGAPALDVRGVDRSSQALALTGEVAVGARLRFAVADPGAASDALADALAGAGRGTGVLAWHAPGVVAPHDVEAPLLAVPSTRRVGPRAAAVAAVLGAR